MSTRVPTLYFDPSGAANTDELLIAAIARAKALGIDQLVVASTEGSTGVRATELVKQESYPGKLVVVTHQAGSREPGVRRMPIEVQRQIEATGAVVVMGTHALSSAERAFREKYGGIDMLEIVADTLRLISAGLKVGIECVLMAADAGAIGVDRDVIAVGGTSRGADTAIVVRPAHARKLLDIKVREIIGMPR